MVVFWGSTAILQYLFYPKYSDILKPYHTSNIKKLSERMLAVWQCSGVLQLFCNIYFTLNIQTSYCLTILLILRSCQRMLAVWQCSGVLRPFCNIYFILPEYSDILQPHHTSNIKKLSERMLAVWQCSGILQPFLNIYFVLPKYSDILMSYHTSNIKKLSERILAIW